MTLIVSLIIYLVIFGLIWWVVSLLPLPAPVDRIVHVLFIILLVLIILVGVGVIPGQSLPVIRL